MKLKWVFVGLIAPVGIIVATCCDGPTGPKPGEKDYVCYFWSLEDSRGLMEFHTATGAVDSMQLPARPGSGGMKVSADGKRLYVNTDTGCVVFDTRTWASLGLLPLGPTAAVLAVSPDNRLLHVSSGGDAYIVSTNGYAVQYFDTSGLSGSSFSTDSRTLYGCGNSNGVDYVYRVQLDSGNAVQRWPFAGVALKQVRPSPDQKSFYARYLVPVRVLGFLAWDIAGDSLREVFARTPGLGDIEVTRDGSRVYFTNYPQSIDITSLIYYSFAYYAVTEDTVYQLNLREFDYPAPTGFDCYGNIEITPDDKRLIALDGRQEGIFLSYDIKSEIVDTSYVLNPPDRGGSLIFLTCPNGR